MALSACDGSSTERQSAEVVVTDSAGIEIVESRAPQWHASAFWTVDSEPELVISDYATDSGTDGVFNSIWNIMGARPLSDGSVAILVPGEDRKVLVFDSSGRLSASFGREGRGPGEFFHPQHLQVLPSDTIVVWDYMFGPVNHFDPSGRLLKDRRIDLGAVIDATRTANVTAGESVLWPLQDGSFLLEVRRTDWRPPTTPGEIYREPVGYVRIDSDYSVHALGWWEGQERLVPGGQSTPPVLPLPAKTLAVATGDPPTVYITNGDRYEVHQFSASGELLRIVRRVVAPIPMTEEAIGRWRDMMEPTNPQWDWRNWDREMAALPGRHFPAIRNFWVDSEGYLWVQDSWNWEHGTSEWSVFDEEGRWLGTVALPTPGIYWVGVDFILGGQIDMDTGLQTVERYRLNRTTRPQ